MNWPGSEVMLLLLDQNHFVEFQNARINRSFETVRNHVIRGRIE